MNLLETRSLTIGYPPDKLLQQNINVCLRPGEIISIMGQNGVGKTTFIKTISSLLPSLSGEVYLKGENIRSLNSRALAQRLSVVLTDRSFSYNLSVLELISLGRHPYSDWMGVLTEKDKDTIEWAITETHTNYLVDKKLYELSDGQLQKVMIARALAQETDLIILDEPAAHLDLYNKIEVMLLLRQIAKKGKGILISTHDMQVSTQLSDKLWLFNFNEPAQVGVPEDLILAGALEKALFLQGNTYDLVHGSVNVSQTGPAVCVTGVEDVKFWTIQALKRNGFNISEKKSPIRIDCFAKFWELNFKGQQTSFHSIERLLEGLNQLPGIG